MPRSLRVQNSMSTEAGRPASRTQVPNSQMQKPRVLRGRDAFARLLVHRVLRGSMDRYFTNRDGLSLRYRLSGSQTGRTVVLIHGVGGRLEDWDKVVANLENDFSVLRFDQRGHGKSDKPAGPYKLAQVASELHELLEHLGVRQINLVGNSLGALIAQQYALDYPNHLETLTIVAGIAGRTPEERERVLSRLAILEKGNSGEHFDNSVRRWYTDEFIAANPEYILTAKEQNISNDPKAYAAAYGILAKNDLADRLHEIKVPTAIVTGEFDQGSNPRMAALMYDRIKGSRLRILPGMRHGIVGECPELVTEVIMDVLSAVDV